MSVIVNRRDLDFILYETLNLEKLLSYDRFSDYDREAINAIFDLSESLAEEKFLPFASKLDANEPAFIDDRVVIIDEVKEALDAYKEAGLFSTCFAQNVGGMPVSYTHLTLPTKA